ncbi:MAG TPA: diacylglycerol kinase family protein [Candidatus Edwardsbacteria bacterium]|nr:diacylglycerol kinase family protein [Candidatus Edwardsbacteria bacterium]
MHRTKIIFNPKSHGGEAAQHLEQVKSLFAAAGIPFELALTGVPGDGAAAAREAVARGFDTVVAAGGDGLAGEVAGALVGTNVVFGMIPLGSGDDFAKSLKIGRSIPLSVEMITRRATMVIDCGTVASPADGQGPEIRRHFFNCVGIGLDGEVIVEKEKIRGLRDLRLYLWATVRALARYKGQRVCLDFGGGNVVWFEALLTEITNGKCIGGGYYISPDAIVDDGLLDLCLVRKLSWLEFFRHVPKVFKGQHKNLKQVNLGRLTAVAVASETPMAAQVDGELWPRPARRFEIAVVPKALECIVGKDTAGDTFKSFS